MGGRVRSLEILKGVDPTGGRRECDFLRAWLAREFGRHLVGQERQLLELRDRKLLLRGKLFELQARYQHRHRIHNAIDLTAIAADGVEDFRFDWFVLGIGAERNVRGEPALEQALPVSRRLIYEILEG